MAALRSVQYRYTVLGAGVTTYDPSIFRNFIEKEFSYIAGFRRNVDRYARSLAIIDPISDTTWTYAELGRQVDLLATGLLRAGVAREQVVTYQLMNSPQFAQLYLATQAAGMIGSPINYRLAPGETAYILDDSQPAAFVYDGSMREATAEALKLAKHRPPLLVCVGPEDPLPGAIRFDDVPASTADLPPLNRSTYDETTRLYTSGTTGLPKGVALNSLVEIFTAHDVIMHFPLTPNDRTLNMTPWFHRGGLYSGGPNPCFYLGAGVVPLAAFDAATCLDHVERYHLTFLVGAPTNLAMLAAVQEKSPRDLSTLKGIVTMGSPLEREATLRYQRVLTPNIFNGYGTTEAFWNTFLRPTDLPEHAGSAGRSCTDDDVAVVRLREDGFAPPDEWAKRDNTEVGEVVVRSPKSGFSYVNSPEQQEAKFRDGWLYIGDLATWDADGYVTIVGRKDDMIITGGENVHPVQVEEALNEHPKVTDSMVVGIPDPKWGRQVVAFVVAADGSLTADECDAHCRAHSMLSDYKRPRAYSFVESLPVTATGKKIHYKATQQATAQYAAGLFATPSR
ncbi:acyl-CoA synthetase (AMP-forming)/AMP-acid ligase II [Antricoccus suffuscus]|uniref:Acyl-CoA synthetase (AMP-forming)/AMP-acid ligase II n=1 Tax=Antricoccus suffuscus TaxID=1629062 RepID=A0A2T0Z029_9ACTN|nr:acyl-CoA synthetase (AMP-forming)/AMP-acid ligase II [Antricoccus suffuscus]